MQKFQIKIIKNQKGTPIGVCAAQINGRDVNITLKDAECGTWFHAVRNNVPSRLELCAIYENKEDVNKALLQAGGEPLKEDWYWSSCGYADGFAGGVDFSSGIDSGYDKFDRTGNIRPLLLH